MFNPVYSITSRMERTLLWYLSMMLGGSSKAGSSRYLNRQRRQTLDVRAMRRLVEIDLQPATHLRRTPSHRAVLLRDCYHSVPAGWKLCVLRHKQIAPAVRTQFQKCRCFSAVYFTVLLMEFEMLAKVSASTLRYIINMIIQ